MAFFPSQFLVRHIFSESGLFDLNIFSELGLFDLNDHFDNLMRQIRHIKCAKRHFDLLCIPLSLNLYLLAYM